MDFGNKMLLLAFLTVNKQMAKFVYWDQSGIVWNKVLKHVFLRHRFAVLEETIFSWITGKLLRLELSDVMWRGTENVVGSQKCYLFLNRVVPSSFKQYLLPFSENRYCRWVRALVALTFVYLGTSWNKFGKGSPCSFPVNDTSKVASTRWGKSWRSGGKAWGKWGLDSRGTSSRYNAVVQESPPFFQSAVMVAAAGKWLPQSGCSHRCAQPQNGC